MYCEEQGWVTKKSLQILLLKTSIWRDFQQKENCTANQVSYMYDLNKRNTFFCVHLENI